MTPRTQSQPITVQIVIFSVQIVHLFVVTGETKVMKQNMHVFYVFIVYGHFEIAIFGRHTKLGHGNLMSVLEAPSVQTLKKLVMFSIFKQKPRKQQKD